MPRSFRVRIAWWLVVSLFAASSASFAQPHPARSFLAQLWNQLATTLWGDSGCIMDPNGGSCRATLLDIGCGMDPNGRCGSYASALESGCGMDPDGGCRGSLNSGASQGRYLAPSSP